MQSKPIPPRPLSPHLQVYRLQITSLLSISHRIAGLGLLFGLIILLVFLYALAEGKATYGMFLELWHNPILFFIKICFVLALCYHFLNGLRHLFWDIGVGFSLKYVSISGWLVILLSIGLTFLIGSNL